jgi:hypothetical protein
LGITAASPQCQSTTHRNENDNNLDRIEEPLYKRYTSITDKNHRKESQVTSMLLPSGPVTGLTLTLIVACVAASNASAISMASDRINSVSIGRPPMR